MHALAAFYALWPEYNYVNLEHLYIEWNIPYVVSYICMIPTHALAGILCSVYLEGT